MVWYEKLAEGYYYLGEKAITSELERDPVRKVLLAIIATDRIWERPTNLFSYFYGMPDSRDGLRLLVTGMTG